MTTLPLYQVDAFTAQRFGGNPAAVCPVQDWLSDERLQAIASENNLSETAFFLPREDDFELRWFTPVAEVELCGHATLATAWVLFERLDHESDSIVFHTRSGPLTVVRDGARLRMDFPAVPATAMAPSAALRAALGTELTEAWAADRDYLVVLESEEDVRGLRPDYARLAELDLPGTIVTAPGDEVDFVSRFFAPALGVPEDPVTGSAHCTLVPYWSRRLGKDRLHARQISTRGGELFCVDKSDRVEIAGECVLYLEGSIHV
jgi:PhzF family phenazine biosynthesis protein